MKVGTVNPVPGISNLQDCGKSILALDISIGTKVLCAKYIEFYDVAVYSVKSHLRMLLIKKDSGSCL